MAVFPETCSEEVDLLLYELCHLKMVLKPYVDSVACVQSNLAPSSQKT